MPVPDLAIAATALVHGATVLHHDRDFERIAEVTDPRHEWIVPPGTGHAGAHRPTATSRDEGCGGPRSGDLGSPGR